MNSLQAALQRLAQLQRQSLDKHALLASISKAQAHSAKKNFATFKVAAELEICAMAQQRQHRSLSTALPRRRP